MNTVGRGELVIVVVIVLGVLQGADYDLIGKSECKER